jgi:TonB system transport protein ExbD (group 1)
MGARFDAGDQPGDMHEINVTPFIDVMLVLLIIFMVAAPLATVDTDVDLPGSAAPRREKPEKPVALTLAADRSLRLDGAPVASEALGGALDRLTGGDRQARIQLKADRSVDYGSMMAVLDRLREAGYLKVALTGQEGGAKP